MIIAENNSEFSLLLFIRSIALSVQDVKLLFRSSDAIKFSLYEQHTLSHNFDTPGLYVSLIARDGKTA